MLGYKPRTGDRLVYTGPYVADIDPKARYGVGVVVGFRDYKQTVVVELEDGGLWAFWRVEETAQASLRAPWCEPGSKVHRRRAP